MVRQQHEAFEELPNWRRQQLEREQRAQEDQARDRILKLTKIESIRRRAEVMGRDKTTVDLDGNK